MSVMIVDWLESVMALLLLMYESRAGGYGRAVRFMLAMFAMILKCNE
jgi:hypothetical protein